MTRDEDFSLETIKTPLTNDDVADAEAFVRALTIQDRLDKSELETVPASLNKRLLDIPDQQQLGAANSWRGLAASVAIIAALLLGLLMDRDEASISDELSYDVAQVERDIAIAFRYIDRAAEMSGEKTAEAINGNVEYAISKGLSLEIGDLTDHRTID